MPDLTTLSDRQIADRLVRGNAAELEAEAARRLRSRKTCATCESLKYDLVIMGHAYTTDTRPPSDAVKRALSLREEPTDG